MDEDRTKLECVDAQEFRASFLNRRQVIVVSAGVALSALALFHAMLLSTNFWGDEANNSQCDCERIWACAGMEVLILLASLSLVGQLVWDGNSYCKALCVRVDSSGIYLSHNEGSQSVAWNEISRILIRTTAGSDGGKHPFALRIWEVGGDPFEPLWIGQRFTGKVLQLERLCEIVAQNVPEATATKTVRWPRILASPVGLLICMELLVFVGFHCLVPLGMVIDYLLSIF